MGNKTLTVEELRELIHKGEVKDPLIFLESVMSGQDPRKLSDIYELVIEIEEFSDGEIAPEDWAEIVDLVSQRYKYRTTTMAESLSASRTLAEYLYAKRKSVELSGDGNLDRSTPAELTPLSEDEAEMFWEKFNECF